MGGLGKDFFDLLSALECEEISFFQEPEGGSLLATLQSDILNLTDTSSPGAVRRPVAPEDPSIRIHSCHSPMREMEVLYDQLLDMFSNNPDLEPRDILVMTPDIESYAAYVHAVFDMPRPAHLRIPFTIADRDIRREGPVIETFLKILDLRDSRFGASQVMAILECPAVRHRFGLREPELETIEQWIAQSGIRWGIDAQSKANQGLPPLPENTWRAGLERLLLGYALPGREEMIFQGIVPIDAVEGESAQVLGRFCEFAEQLFAAAGALHQSRSLDQWTTTLSGLLDTFFEASEDGERDLQVLRRMIFSMKEAAETASFPAEVDVDVIRWHLGRSAEREGFGLGFMTGGVTFCALLPMRSVPFQVICLVGMNHEAYPRQARPVGFDLMAKHPRKGDRSRRDDDRYLFLEALLSARETLYISYIGQNIQDNHPVPPSVLVSELLDYVEQGFEVHDRSIRDHLITHHRLQAFSPEYFKEYGALISYSEENLKAARRLVGPKQTPEPFIPKGLPVPDEEWRRVDLEDLCRFWENPSKYLLSKRMGIYLQEGATVLQDGEPFEVTGLEKYLLEQELAERALSGESLRDLLPLYRASSRLPHGTLGTCTFQDLSSGVMAFVKKTLPLMEGDPLEPIESTLSVGDFTLTGKLGDLYAHRMVRHRYARLTPKNRLRAWIAHLFLNATAPPGYPTTTVLLGLEYNHKNEVQWLGLEYPSVTAALEILAQLLADYWEGLQRPLHFFPHSSWEYARWILQAGKDPEHAMSRARGQWMGNDFSRGEREDIYIQQCFRNTDPLDRSFQDLALGIFTPVMEKEKRL
jgi:exodeoxyribonuclease V gamma subunit